MPSAYLLRKWVHVVLAILAVGANAVYGILLARAHREPTHLGHVLRSVKFLDDRVANPACGLLLVTGVAMVVLGEWPWRTAWLATAIAMYAVVVVLGLGVYTPTLRRQIEALEAEGPTAPGYLALRRRGTIVGVVLAVLVLAIAYLMVVKPGGLL
ncbi:MAG: DUF2269 family protein [Methanobacteriota archaeon]